MQTTLAIFLLLLAGCGTQLQKIKPIPNLAFSVSNELGNTSISDEIEETPIYLAYDMREACGDSRAVACYNAFNIKITSHFLENAQEFCLTLAHEYIHAFYQLTTGNLDRYHKNTDYNILSLTACNQQTTLSNMVLE